MQCISADVHQKLTALLGELTAQTSRLQTYQDAIEAMLNQSVYCHRNFFTRWKSS
ncbi:MAG: hypothetical protein QXO15_12215 [Nitrososphaerota archaeon]